MVDGARDARTRGTRTRTDTDAPSFVETRSRTRSEFVRLVVKELATVDTSMSSVWSCVDSLSFRISAVQHVSARSGDGC
jgi:hypothetical protein